MYHICLGSLTAVAEGVVPETSEAALASTAAITLIALAATLELAAAAPALLALATRLATLPFARSMADDAEADTDAMAEAADAVIAAIVEDA